MHPPRSIPLVLRAVLLGATVVCAADPKPVDPDLPQPLNPAVADSLLQSSPFTRSINLSESLRLTGVAFVGGKPVATVKDRSTGKRYVVTETPNALGWKLADAWPASEVNGIEVRIIVGGEIVELRYADTSGGSKARPVSSGSVSSGPSRFPTPQEFTGKDEKGEYVRGVPYLSDSDREKFRNIPRDVREKFLNLVHDHRDTLFKASHEERADFVKKAFDATVGK